MITATVAEVAAAVGGSLADGADPGAVVLGVTSDSRTVQPGSLFVALSGTRVDGHEFAGDAVASGAVAVLAVRPVGTPTIVVDDVLIALGKLARFHLGRLPDTTVVAITGSVGKTTTKDLLADLLQRLGPTVAPPGSFNNELGLPLTVLSATRETRFLVLEMGARAESHISYLCEIAPPTIGVELMVGSAHVGEFGGRDSIARAKAELVRALPDSGVAVLNADDDQVMAMAALSKARVVTFGTAKSAVVRAVDIVVDERDRPTFRLVTPDGAVTVPLGLSGTHLVVNALAAAAVAWSVGMAPEHIAAALATAQPRSRWRMEVTDRSDGITVINDAYNASPESMRAALKSLKQIASGRRAWAVLGEMRELGNDSAAEHDAIGRLAVRLDVQRLVVVGEEARPIHLGASLEGSWGDESMVVPDATAAIQLLEKELLPGDVVLVKASRAVGLERVAHALLHPAESARRVAAGDDR
jgi:UDP-N-acetylmuramoyl-tripeptide--D-alanyl-D-alanine ligase